MVLLLPKEALGESSLRPVRASCRWIVQRSYSPFSCLCKLLAKAKPDRFLSIPKRDSVDVGIGGAASAFAIVARVLLNFLAKNRNVCPANHLLYHTFACEVDEAILIEVGVEIPSGYPTVKTDEKYSERANPIDIMKVKKSSQTPYRHLAAHTSRFAYNPRQSQ